MKHFIVKEVKRYPHYTVLTMSPKHDRDRMKFYAGQYATVGFRRNGKLTPVRCFSITTAPNNNGELQFGIRVTGDFTRALNELAVGDNVRIRGPYGDFVVDTDHDRNIIMLAGGIGITPFISMLRWATEHNVPIPMTLLYACRSAADIPFYEELIALAGRNPRIRIAFVVRDGDTNNTPGVYSGEIDDKLISRVSAERFSNYTYFICGPDGFMKSMNQILVSHEVSEANIITESFVQTNKISGVSKLTATSLTYALTGIALVAGTGAVMLIDLARSVPKIAAAESAHVASTDGTTTDTSPTADSNSSNTSDSTSSNNSSNSTTQTPSTSVSTPAPVPTQTQTPTYTYQPPISSIS